MHQNQWRGSAKKRRGSNTYDSVDTNRTEQLARLKQRLGSQLSPFNLTEEQNNQLVKELDDYAKLIIDVHLSYKNRTSAEQVAD